MAGLLPMLENATATLDGHRPNGRCLRVVVGALHSGDTKKRKRARWTPTPSQIEEASEHVAWEYTAMTAVNHVNVHAATQGRHCYD
jgi:hypothetical protein